MLARPFSTQNQLIQFQVQSLFRIKSWKVTLASLTLIVSQFASAQTAVRAQITEAPSCHISAARTLGITGLRRIEAPEFERFLQIEFPVIRLNEVRALFSSPLRMGVDLESWASQLAASLDQNSGTFKQDICQAARQRLLFPLAPRGTPNWVIRLLLRSFVLHHLTEASVNDPNFLDTLSRFILQQQQFSFLAPSLVSLANFGAGPLIKLLSIDPGFREFPGIRARGRITPSESQSLEALLQINIQEALAVDLAVGHDSNARAGGQLLSERMRPASVARDATREIHFPFSNSWAALYHQ